MTPQSLETAHRRYDSEMQTLHDTYGSWSAIPVDERTLASERLRAAYCLAIFNGTAVEAMKHYSIDRRVAEELVGDITHVPKKKRIDPRIAIEEWCITHEGETVDANTIADAAGCSYATALDITKDRLDLFTQQKKGHYLVRNPHNDRKQEQSL